MAIKRIKFSNFKSFEDQSLDLDALTIAVGANASGKSNVIHVLRFLRDIVKSGLKDAISLQGGSEYLLNIKQGASRSLDIEIQTEFRFYSHLFPSEDKEIYAFRSTHQEYAFSLVFDEKSYKVTKETYKVKYKLYDGDEKDLDNASSKGAGSIILDRKNNEYSLRITTPKGIKFDSKFRSFIKREYDEFISDKKLLLEQQTSVFIPPLNIPLRGIALYDFEPKLCQKAVVFSGKSELSEDGSNLPIVLRDILESSGNKKKLYTLLKSLLPFISDIDVDKAADKYIFSRFQEKFSKTDYLPASLMSTGTINLTAIVVALYFGRESLVVVEEPERYIHPQLLPRLMDMFKEAAKQKQVLITTHSPELLKYADLSSLRFVSRDNRGFSSISLPESSSIVRTFLSEELGIEDLFTQNLLH